MIEQGIGFYFTPFPSEIKFGSDTVILGFGFEEQEDTVLSGKFPEFEARRKIVDKIPNKGDEVYFFPIFRKNKTYNAAFIYIQYPWKKKREIKMGGINFLREVLCSTMVAVKKIKAEGYKKVFIVLPNRFSPRNVKDEEQRQHLYQFVSTVTEAIVYANNPYTELKTNQPTKIEEVTFSFFGKSQKSLDAFFQKAITDGELMGAQLANIRRLADTPPNLKTPVGLASDVLNIEIEEGESVEGWEKFKITPNITGYLLRGSNALVENNFRLIDAVNKGSGLTPCVLRLHYKPDTRRQKRVKRVVIQGKGVAFDTGGHDLKGTDYYTKMEYDMLGAATAWAIPFLAEDFNLPVEVIVVTPLVRNMIGPEGTIPGAIVKAYDGKSVQILNTDAEGRLILADVLAYSEQKFDPDAMITIGSLGDVSDFGPDFLKIGIVGNNNEYKVRLAEKLSTEKVLMLPKIDMLNKVDDMHLGDTSDLVNDVPPFHSAPFVFLYNFFKNEPNWFFVDNSAAMEIDADEYGTGPGFGVKFVWNIVKQYA